MAANIKPEALKQFSPLAGLAVDPLNELIEAATLLKIAEGKMLFKRNDADEFMYWLIEGSVDLLDEKFNVTKVAAGDEGSKDPLDSNSPHKVTVVSTAESTFLKAEKAMIDRFVSRSESDPYSVSGLHDVHELEVDWMSILLSSPLFEFVPPANIQSLFAKFEEVIFEEGEAVIRQGEAGDYFYVITIGTAKVERTADDKTSVLAQLEPGAFFGEDALISDVPRNATITMLTPGKLMRLSEPDFESLLQKPLMEVVTFEEALEMTVMGETKTYILDVRNTEEISAGSKIEGSVDLPLLKLRKNLDRLKQDAIYVTRCDGGKRCELAAYILNQSGYTAYVMKDAPND